jgi:NADH:ubiquinone oxidoreductase subunit 4 (subunit M)
MVYLWLPRAHFKAPISGSVMAAGVLSKVGGYELLRVFFPPVLFKFGFVYGAILGCFGFG